MVCDLAQKISEVDFRVFYDQKKLKDDWKNLCEWKTNDNYINSTSRIGMKLCEHFFPNFYDIESKGKSFSSLWTQENLVRVLRWNRKSHSTPYLSELKRGIYFCLGLTKSTMYRPQMAKMICMKYRPELVLDPCAGWGGRMLGAVSSGSQYIAFEPNVETYENLNRLAEFLEITDRVKLICDDAMKMGDYNLPNVDLVLTSPPYFDLEIYTHDTKQSVDGHDNYTSWSNYFLKGIIEKCNSLLKVGGVSCWNVAKFGKNDMWADVKLYNESLGFFEFDKFDVNSSKRPTNNSKKENKNSDTTLVYKKP